MKTITLMAAFVVASISLNAQKVYDFTGSQNPGTWIKASSGISVTPSAAGLVFEFGTGTPRIDITRAADPFDVSVGTHMLVTFINNNTEIGSFSPFSDKNGVGESGTNFMSFQTGMTKAATPGTGVEKTYVYKLTGSYLNDGGEANNTNAISDMEYIGVRFRNDAGNALVGTSAADGNIILKKIQIINAGVLGKLSYDFASDNIGGFSGTNGGSITAGTTTLNFAGDNSNTTPKIAQNFYGVDATVNKYAHITVDSNTSNADEVKLQFIDGLGATQTYGSSTLNIGSSTMLDLSLSGKAEWTGTIKEWRLVFSNSSSAAVNTGAIKVSKVVFDNNDVLSSHNIVSDSFSFYPNPVNSTLNLNAKNPISKVQIFDLTGRKVLETANLNSNSLNVSQLKSGLYILNVYTNNNELMTKKMLKN